MNRPEGSLWLFAKMGSPPPRGRRRDMREDDGLTRDVARQAHYKWNARVLWPDKSNDGAVL